MSIMQHANSSSVFVTAIFLGIFLSATSAPAQSSSTDPSVSPATEVSEVKTFTVAPLQRTAAVLMPNAQTPKPPERLDSQRKSEILHALGGTEAVKEPGVQPTPELEYLLLSAKQPFVSEQAFLTLVLAYAVHPETAIKFDKDFPGSAAVKLNVKKGQTYLLDFAVKSWGSGKYLLETESGKLEFEDELVNKQHILVALKATSSGWTTVRLKREGTGYHLYFVEITRVEQNSPK
jgi:hypothetical protein